MYTCIRVYMYMCVQVFELKVLSALALRRRGVHREEIETHIGTCIYMYKLTCIMKPTHSCI